MSESVKVGLVGTFGIGLYEYWAQIWQMILSSKNGSFLLYVNGLSSAPPAPVITSITPGMDGGNPILTFDFTSPAWDNYTWQVSTDPAFGTFQSGFSIVPGTMGGSQEVNPTPPLLAGTLYYIRMKIQLGGMDSGWSNTASGTTPDDSDPLAAITFKLRLQALKGFGATPNDPYSLFQDATLFTPATTNGDPIKGWIDSLSGSGENATQSNGANQGTLQIDNGIPTVSGAGSTFFDLLSNISLSPSGFTLIVMQKTIGQVNFFGHESLNKQARVDAGNPATMFAYAGGGPGSALGAVDRSVYQVLSYQSDGSTVEYFIDGVSQGTTGIANDFELNTIFNLTGGFLMLNGNVTALFAADPLSVSDRNTVENFCLNNLNPN
jgi:hypothetical protein